MPRGGVAFACSPSEGVGAGAVLTLEYVVRGDIPLGPVWPGAVLFATATGAEGKTVAVDLVESGRAEPCDAAALSHTRCSDAC